MGELVHIGNTQVEQIVYKETPVVTLKMVDQLHERLEGSARKSFNRHKKELTEGEDYFQVPYREWRELSAVSLTDISKQHAPMIFLSETGYLLVIKPFNDKKSWEIQKQIVKTYFKMKAHFQGKHDGRLDSPDLMTMMMKQQDAIIQILQNLTQTRERPSTKAIPHVTQENSVTDLSGEEVFPKKVIRQPFGKNNPLYRKLKEKGHWMTVTMVAKEKLQGQVSFETCRRAIYDGSVNIRPTIFFKICGALDFTREEIIKIMRDYGYTDFVDMLEGI
jgi:hypothetical protein